MKPFKFALNAGEADLLQQMYSQIHSMKMLDTNLWVDFRIKGLIYKSLLSMVYIFGTLPSTKLAVLEITVADVVVVGGGVAWHFSSYKSARWFLPT